MAKTMVMKVFPLKHMQDHAGAYTHTAARGRLHAGAGGCVLKEAGARGNLTLEQDPGRSSSLWGGAHVEEGFLAQSVTPCGTHAGAACF